MVLGSMRSFCLGAEEPQVRYVDLDEAGDRHLETWFGSILAMFPCFKGHLEVQ